MSHTLKVLTSPARFKLAICGRRWGKTGCALLASLRGHGAYPGQWRGALNGGRIWWVAPSYPQIQASNIWEDLKRATRDAACKQYGGNISEADRVIVLPGGGSITVKSADNPDSLRGPGLDGVVFDEGAFIKEECWTEVIRPALADKNGWGLIITTPNGRNWIHRRYTESIDATGDWASWRCPTSENPLVTAKELASIKREIGPRRFAQEHEAAFTEPEGALFPGSYFDGLWAETWPDAFEVSAMYLDPAMGKRAKRGDFQALAFVGLSGGLLWCEMQLIRVPPTELIAAVHAMYRRLQPTYLGAESNGFQELLQPLAHSWCRERNLPPMPIASVINSTAKEVRIASLDPWLENGHLRVNRDAGGELLIEQLQMYPDKDYHDDGPDALEGAIRLLNMSAGQEAELETDFEQAEI